MTEWCLSHGIRLLLTAHTRDDQAETVAMRKTRTMSARSLAGIWPVMAWQGVQVLRPLLDRSRAELRDLLVGLGQGWIDDPSNENAKFERVRVRRNLSTAEIPCLAAEADAARAASVADRDQARAWLRRVAVISPFGCVRLPRLAFQALSLPVAEDVLTWALMACGAGQRPERGEVGRMILALRGSGPVRRTLAGALVAARQRDIVVGREPGRLETAPVLIGSDGNCHWDGRFVVTGATGSRVAPAGPTEAGQTAHFGLKHAGLPAFVRHGLPKVLLPCGTALLPHLEPHYGVEVRLSERFAI
jgi:tRNA(Ile)-lysidine synthase